jgi:hypothetical protein
MKISVDVDCTPEEARAFLGLPDVAPIQGAVMEEVQKRIMDNLSAMDPETLTSTWIPAGIQSFEHLQKMFWSQMTAGTKPKD